ncbi:MAG: hypothetical protein OEU09_18345 [Rhodospirillales bacterium]|nr:hypothetical protein [Rhodospirillales bacterium]MDH3913245.1 hypothetical protein [Rhodospirillales bacterium]MDH3920481.1 hypothetical protein [Rhodospirillales bacterium]MDH3969219.1 hypothetical protein [Rhodospirillales bacterium]
MRGAYELHRVRGWRSGEGTPWIHGGKIDYAEGGRGQAPTRFISKTQGNEVLSFDLLTEEAWSEMVKSGSVRDY